MSGLLLGIGWLGNVCFFSRFLVQWILSERARKSVAPRAFWLLSLAGAACTGIYTSWRGELVLLVGCLFNACIAGRNLWLQLRTEHRPPRLTVLAAATILGAGIMVMVNVARPIVEVDRAWFACAVLGQMIWSLRFLIQLWASERVGRSHFPQAFWWASLAGNLMLLAYALHRRDAVLVAGFAVGPVVQVRNLMLSGALGVRGRGAAVKNELGSA